MHTEINECIFIFFAKRRPDTTFYLHKSLKTIFVSQGMLKHFQFHGLLVDSLLMVRF